MLVGVEGGAHEPRVALEGLAGEAEVLEGEEGDSVTEVWVDCLVLGSGDMEEEERGGDGEEEEIVFGRVEVWGFAAAFLAGGCRRF